MGGEYPAPLEATSSEGEAARYEKLERRIASNSLVRTERWRSEERSEAAKERKDPGGAVHKSRGRLRLYPRGGAAAEGRQRALTSLPRSTARLRARRLAAVGNTGPASTGMVSASAPTR